MGCIFKGKDLSKKWCYFAQYSWICFERNVTLLSIKEMVLLSNIDEN